ncbi:hypothetical protein ACOSQ3_016044 [Xanthoceras sorbifolium]
MSIGNSGYLLKLGYQSPSLYFDPFFNDFIQYKELSYNLHQVISDLVDRHPLILPDPHMVTLFEIVRFTFLDEEEENPLFLQEVLQDLMTMGSNSEFFVWFLEGVLLLTKENDRRSYSDYYKIEIPTTSAGLGGKKQVSFLADLQPGGQGRRFKPLSGTKTGAGADYCQEA